MASPAHRDSISVPDINVDSSAAAMMSANAQVSEEKEQPKKTGFFQRFMKTGKKEPTARERKQALLRKKEEKLRQEAENRRKQRALEEDKKAAEDEEARAFWFRLSRIVLYPISLELKDVFIEVVVGGATQERIVSSDGRPTDKETGSNTVLEEGEQRVFQIVRPYSERIYTLCVPLAKANEDTMFRGEWSGKWEGTYKDLADDELEVTVWKKKWGEPNELVGRNTLALQRIAKDKPDQEITIYRGSLSGPQSSRVDSAAIVRFRLEFQEYFDFKIEFRDWQAPQIKHNPLVIKDPDEDRGDDTENLLTAHGTAVGDEVHEAGLESTMVTVPPMTLTSNVVTRTPAAIKAAAKRKKKPTQNHRLDFSIRNSHDNPISHFFRTVKKIVTFQCGSINSKDHGTLELLNGSSRQEEDELWYHGTRSWLEDENLIISLYKVRTCCGLSCASMPCCGTIKLAQREVSLQGVVDHGFLIASLEEEPRVAHKLKILRAEASHMCRQCCVNTARNFSFCTRIICFLPWLIQWFLCAPLRWARVQSAEDLNDFCDHTTRIQMLAELSKMDEADLDKLLTMQDNKKDKNVIKTISQYLERSKPTQTVKGVVRCLEQPRHRQFGNAGAPQRSVSLFAPTSPDTYLVIKIIRGRVHSLGEYKESLQPSVTVEWIGMKKVTQSVAGSEPFWDIELWFRIPNVQKSPPESIWDFGKTARKHRVQLCVWDNNMLSREVLGYCELDFDTIYQTRLESDVIDKSSQNGKSRRFICKRTMALKIPAKQVVERDHDKTRPTEEKMLIENRFLEFHCWFDRTDNNRIEAPIPDPSIKVAEGGGAGGQDDVPEDAEVDPAPMPPDQQFRGAAVWNELLKAVPDRKSRYFAFMGKDEYTSGMHFLPTFVKPMPPPTTIQQLDKLLYFVSCIEHEKRPWVDKSEEDAPDRKLRRQFPNTWVWCDPFFFLEKRKGDVNDHALLLCNFLLGLDMKAYVCIGTVKTKEKNLVPHVWVMTVEEEDDPIKKDEFEKWSADLRKKLGLTEVDDEDEKKTEEEKKAEEEERKRKKAEEMERRKRETRRKFVRFWETQNGKTYKLSDEEGWRFAPSGVTAAEMKKRMQERAAEVSAALSKAPKADAAPKPKKKGMIKKMLNKGVKGVQEAGNAIGDMANEGAELVVGGAEQLKQAVTGSAEEEEQKELAEEEEPDELKTGDLADGAITVDTGASTSVFEAGRMSRVDMTRQELIHQRQQLAPVLLHPTVGAKNFKTLTPYVTIDVVFNHKYLYGNLQEAHPERISYLFKDKLRWCLFPQAVWSEFVRTRRIIVSPQPKMKKIRTAMMRAKRGGRGVQKKLTKEEDAQKAEVEANAMMKAITSVKVLPLEDGKILYQPRLTAFYYDRTLPSSDTSIPEIPVDPRSKDKAVQSRTPFQQVEHEILERIKETVRSHREFECHEETEFGDEFFINAQKEDSFRLIEDRLESESKAYHEYPLFYHDILKKFNEKAHTKMDDNERNQTFAQSSLEDARALWTKPILESLDGKSRYVEKVLLFRYSDADKISDGVLEACRKMIEVKSENIPLFFVGVKIEMLPAMVSPIRVFLCVLYQPKVIKQ